MNKKDEIKVLDDREHLLLRPQMYIGAVDKTEINDFVINNDTNKVENKVVSIVPGLVKIINEIIDNSIDVAIKTNFEYSNIIKVNISDTEVSVKDNGTGIPVKENNGIYLPRLCWGFARAGSNFNNDNRTQIGMNGVGSYTSNVFSTKFTGITDDGTNHYEITFIDNASQFDEKISKSKKQGTEVIFEPDLKRFKLTKITEEHKKILYTKDF